MLPSSLLITNNQSTYVFSTLSLFNFKVFLQQTIEYLQTQLEELAHEQENQLAENMMLVGRLNTDIQRFDFLSIHRVVRMF